jgi:hypothetical protein
MLGQRPLLETWGLAVPSLLHEGGEGAPRLDRGADEVLQIKKAGRFLSRLLQTLDDLLTGAEGQGLRLDLRVAAEVFGDFFPTSFDVGQSFINGDFVREIASEFAVEDY